MSGATNDAEQLAMEEEGVEKQDWVTAGDEVVRDPHVAEGAGPPVKLGEPFPVTGLLYPGHIDGAAEQVINCRCTTYIADKL